jgi:transposase
METLFEEILGISGLHIFSIEQKHDGYFLHCETSLKSCNCTKCGAINSKVKQTYARTIRDLPISGKRVYLILYSKQYHCSACGSDYYERYDFVEPNQTTTKRYEAHLYFLSKGADLTYVATKETISWKTVNRIVKTYSQKTLKNYDGYALAKRIGIDEISLRKGHRNFVVIITDLDTRKILDILENRDKKALIAYFKEKGKVICERIEIFCSDMWEGYLNTAKEVFPNAVITADRFHVFAKLQDALDHTRKYLRKTFKEDESLKGIRYSLLKNPENLNDKELIELNDLLKNPKYELLKASYEAKNEFRNI